MFRRPTTAVHPRSLLLLAGLTGCGGPSEEPPTWWADARPIVAARCATCHVEGDIGPFPLVTLDEVRAHAGLVRTSVQHGSMPPWPPSDDCNTYGNARALTPAEEATLLSWLDAGLPEGDPADAVALPSPPALEPDLVLTLPEPYTPRTSPDDYRCLLVPWPEQAERFITGIEVIPERRDLVHHVIIFAVPAELADEYLARDEAEEGPGYTCYGGPSGEAEGVTLGGPRPRWVGGWTPGTPGVSFPAGTGIRMTPGDLLIVQMHYNTADAEGGSDQSQIALKLADAVQRPAAMLPLTDLGWVSNGVFGEAMTIPAGEASVTHTTAVPLLKSPLFAAMAGAELGHQAGQRVQIHNVGLHMHELGRAAHTRVRHADGGETCLLDIPRWDFHWQGAYRLAEPVTVAEDDAVELSCTWDNSRGTEDVTWGEGTSDEMCLSVLFLTLE